MLKNYLMILYVYKLYHDEICQLSKHCFSRIRGRMKVMGFVVFLYMLSKLVLFKSIVTEGIIYL